MHRGLIHIFVHTRHIDLLIISGMYCFHKETTTFWGDDNFNPTVKKARELHPLKIPKGPWKEISIDIIGPLPKSNEKDVIIVIVYWFTKMIQLKAITTNISSKEIAKIYHDKI